MTGRKHTVVIIMTVVLLCIALFGAFLFIAASASHKCSHDGGCEVCRMIDVCLHYLRGSVLCSAAVTIAAAAAAAAAAVALRTGVCLVPDTLLSLRTELRN